MSTITNTQTRPCVAHKPVTLPRMIRSEWIKISTLRSTWITLTFALIGVVGIGAIASAVAQSSWVLLNGEGVTIQPIDMSLSGILIAQLVIGVLGVLIVTGEYSTGMIRATLAASPKRLRMMVAKLTISGAVAFVSTLLGAALAFFVGQALLGEYGVNITDDNALRAVVGSAVFMTLVALFASALGFLLRSTAGGIAALFGILLVLPVIMSLLPGSWSADLVPYLPSNAGASLYAAVPSDLGLSAVAGFFTMLGWVAVATIAAGITLKRRDA